MTASILQGARVTDIIVVSIEDILLKIYINVNSADKRYLIKLSINDDGETVSFALLEDQMTIDSIHGEIFIKREIEDSDDELSALIGRMITGIQFGVGKTAGSDLAPIYYIRINTTGQAFLFFNNGDIAAYSVNKIDHILENSIYELIWINEPPVRNHRGRCR